MILTALRIAFKELVLNQVGSSQTIYGTQSRILQVPTTQLPCRKGLGPCDALLRVSHTLQSLLESG